MQAFWSKRMLSKRQRPYDESELPAANRLRANIRDMFASNTLPASRVQSLLMCSNFLATIPRLVVAGVATRLLLRFSTDFSMFCHFEFGRAPLQECFAATASSNTSKSSNSIKTQKQLWQQTPPNQEVSFVCYSF